MVDLILDKWDEIHIQIKILIVFLTALLMFMFVSIWSISIGSDNVLELYNANNGQQYIIYSKDRFSKLYELQVEKQAEVEREENDEETEVAVVDGEYEYIGTDKVKIPYYTQGDPRWGSTILRPDSSTNVANSGCGLTSIAMVKSYLTGEFVTPVDIYNSIPERDFQGSMGWEAPASALNPIGYNVTHFGSNGTVSEEDYARLLDGLENGGIGLVSFHPGDFTGGGHIAVIKCTDGSDGTWINDPNANNVDYCKKPVSKVMMMSNAKQFWLITR